MYQPMIVSYKNREAEVDIVCGAGNSALQIVFENSVQMNKVSTYPISSKSFLLNSIPTLYWFRRLPWESWAPFSPHWGAPLASTLASLSTLLWKLWRLSASDYIKLNSFINPMSLFERYIRKNIVKWQDASMCPIINQLIEAGNWEGILKFRGFQAMQWHTFQCTFRNKYFILEIMWKLTSQ